MLPPLPHLGDQAALDVDHKTVAHIVLLQAVLYRGDGQAWQQAWEDSNTARAEGQWETRRRNTSGVLWKASCPCKAGSSQTSDAHASAGWASTSRPRHRLSLLPPAVPPPPHDSKPPWAATHHGLVHVVNLDQLDVAGHVVLAAEVEHLHKCKRCRS